MRETRVAILYDREGTPVLVADDGVRKIAIVDMDTVDLLQQILVQLKAINIQLEVMTDNRIGAGDVE